jgi:segregation and condensation protein B
MPLDILIEAMLFYKAAPQKKTLLLKIFAVSETDFVTAVQLVRSRLEAGATRLVVTDTDITLTSSPEVASLIEQLRKDEQKRDIGKAGAETLAIILYRGPIARGEIDRIRGVNSGYILRNLAVRGLIERSTNQKRVEYQITPQLLQHLGITHKQALPGFDDIMNQLEAYQRAKDVSEQENMLQ